MLRSVPHDLAVAALSAAVLAAGCVSFEPASPAPSPALPEPSELATLELELGAEDDLPPPLPAEPLPLVQRAPPADWAQRVPGRPEVSGRLAVPLGRRWDYIVIHHSDTASGNERVFDRYARNERGWLGVGYHFVIGNGNGSGDGEVEVTFRWEKQLHGAHAGVKKYNEHGIGICLVGDFARGHPTPRQMASLAALINYLQERCRIPTAHILLHRHLKNTRCPGENFPFYDLTALLDH